MTGSELKAFCKKQGLTYKELAENIGYGEGAIKGAIATNKVSSPMEFAISMYLKIKKLESEIKSYQELKKVLKEIIKED
ncbi:transcriptional regulator [Helicobacter sp. 13S00401-1]|uniref:transcriptional regulator n=1 Tax=Helicobacter sp. 13S00401-1 TaxID=1905758 RepID=UPI000BA7587E|nr:transcriptional regulator [Helicobacter sp. 13S00401-1]PAF50381.1 transcriptional regulator [Helicobacter sp. 13S00401-1]